MDLFWARPEEDTSIFSAFIEISVPKRNCCFAWYPSEAQNPASALSVYVHRVELWSVHPANAMVRNAKFLEMLPFETAARFRDSFGEIPKTPRCWWRARAISRWAHYTLIIFVLAGYAISPAIYFLSSILTFESVWLYSSSFECAGPVIRLLPLVPTAVNEYTRTYWCMNIWTSHLSLVPTTIDNKKFRLCINFQICSSYLKRTKSIFLRPILCCRNRSLKLL